MKTRMHASKNCTRTDGMLMRPCTVYSAILQAVWLLLVPTLPASGGDLEDLARPHEGRSMRATSSHRSGPDGKYDPNAELDPHSNWDNQNVPPGETKILMDEKGPGVITHIWMTFLAPEPHPWAKNGSANHQEMLLRIYYDGNERPGVEAPVGDFFANAFGKRSQVISVPVVVEDADSYNCFWRMPFRESIRIEIVNQSAKPISLLYYNIDWIKKTNLPDDTPYLYAQYRQEYPAVGGRDYLILETDGKGHYVGTVLSVRTRSPAWFGEGDEKIYIDGESKASIWGTGTEDYFLSAWGLKTTSTPYFGTPYFDQWGVVGGHTSAYRWHIQRPDRIQHRASRSRSSTTAGSPPMRIRTTRPTVGTSARMTTRVLPSGISRENRPSPPAPRTPGSGSCPISTRSSALRSLRGMTITGKARSRFNNCSTTPRGRFCISPRVRRTPGSKFRLPWSEKCRCGYC